jgi:hypothetical protein
VRKRLSTSAWQRPTEPAPGPAAGARGRVLIENPHGVLVDAYEDALRAAGFEVGSCAGPSAAEPCPLVTEEACPLVAGADVVVCGLDFDQPESRAVLDALRTHHGGAAVVVQVPDRQVGEVAPAAAGFRLVPASVDPADLVAAVEGALAAR